MMSRAAVHATAATAPLAPRPPAPFVWLNGAIVATGEAHVSVLDRGFLFGDGVYELVRFFGGVGVGMELHVARLARSLELTRITGFDARGFPAIADELLRANDLRDASVYLQVSRGATPNRSHVPPPGLRPTVVGMATPMAPLSELRAPESIRAALVPDERWLRCEIKTTSLMGNVLAAMAAAERGADEAILHRDGVVSEGGSTNVFIRRGARLATPAIGDVPPILHGVSRAQILEVARAEGLRVDERRIPVEELTSADEVMITSSRRLLSSVVMLDGVPVGTGAPGAAAVQLFGGLCARLHSAV